MDYERVFNERLDALRAEGRYRIFADLERRCGCYPRIAALVTALSDVWSRQTPRRAAPPDTQRRTNLLFPQVARVRARAVCYEWLQIKHKILPIGHFTDRLAMRMWRG